MYLYKSARKKIIRKPILLYKNNFDCPFCFNFSDYIRRSILIRVIRVFRWDSCCFIGCVPFCNYCLQVVRGKTVPIVIGGKTSLMTLLNISLLFFFHPIAVPGILVWSSLNLLAETGNAIRAFGMFFFYSK